MNKLEENCGKNQTEDHISATANKKSDYHELKRNIKLPHHTASYNNHFQGFSNCQNYLIRCPDYLQKLSLLGNFGPLPILWRSTKALFVT